MFHFPPELEGDEKEEGVGKNAGWEQRKPLVMLNWCKGSGRTRHEASFQQKGEKCKPRAVT